MRNEEGSLGDICVNFTPGMSTEEEEIQCIREKMVHTGMWDGRTVSVERKFIAANNNQIGNLIINRHCLMQIESQHWPIKNIETFFC